MSNNSHSSKIQDVLARMKAAKAEVEESPQTETSSEKVSAAGPITASTIQKPKDIGATPGQFSSLKKETVSPIEDNTAELEAAFEEERRQREARASQIQNQIDSLLGANDATIARLQHKRDYERIIHFLLSDMINAGIKKLFQVDTNVKIACTAIAGFMIGRTMRLNVANSLHPSILAASTSSMGRLDCR